MGKLTMKQLDERLKKLEKKGSSAGSDEKPLDIDLRLEILESFMEDVKAVKVDGL